MSSYNWDCTRLLLYLDYVLVYWFYWLIRACYKIFCCILQCSCWLCSTKMNDVATRNLPRADTILIWTKKCVGGTLRHHFRGMAICCSFLQAFFFGILKKTYIVKFNPRNWKFLVCITLDAVPQVQQNVCHVSKGHTHIKTFLTKSRCL